MEPVRLRINGVPIEISGDVLDQVAVDANGTRSLGVYQQGDESVLTVRVNLDESTKTRVVQLEKQAQQALLDDDPAESRRCRALMRDLEETVLVRVPHAQYE